MGNVREPVKESSKEKKKRIIEKGFQLMCEKGYHNVSCVDIAIASQVSTGIIYQYFKDKKDIFIAGSQQYYKKWMFPMLDILTKEKITQENIDKILNQMVEESIQIHTLTKKAHKELISMRCLDQEAFHIFSNSEEEMTERIVNHLQQGNSIKEKVHLTLHLIDMISHEIVYHKHENYNYEKMKTETIQTIKFILKDVLS